jgi:hypothetical protein
VRITKSQEPIIPCKAPGLLSKEKIPPLGMLSDPGELAEREIKNKTDTKEISFEGKPYLHRV